MKKLVTPLITLMLLGYGVVVPAAQDKSSAARPAGGKPKAAAPPTVKPAASQNVIVFKEPERYGGWPANHGLWQWGDELVAGFTF